MDIEAKISPERAWLAVKDQLKMDLSKSSFDTWVLPATFVYFRDGLLTVGCPHNICRDWLANRLTTTIERTLNGILHEKVSVQFIVDKVPDCLESESPDQPTEPDEDLTEVDFVYPTLRNAILEPNRVVRLPTYLFRWIPYVGAQTIFLVLAFWQEYYLTSKGNRQPGKQKVSVRAERICQWAGISRAQFFRNMQPGGPLDWFVKKVETDFEADRRTGRMKKSANKYVLYDIPITPGDAEDLRRFLIDHGAQRTPLDALRQATSMDPKLILRYPFRKPSQIVTSPQPHPQSVQAVIQESIGKKLDPEISELADQLSDRLIERNDFILVSWYFLKNWLPHLGPDAAMFILMLRNHCYFNDQKGEIRDEVWMDDGYESIAARLGLSNPRLISTWFETRVNKDRENTNLSESSAREFARRKKLQNWLGSFIQRIGHRPGVSGAFSWKFKVNRFDPLLPRHEQMVKGMEKVLAKYDPDDLPGETEGWFEQLENACFETINKGETIDLRLSTQLKDCPETLKPIIDDCFETIDWNEEDCSETLLKILKNIKNSNYQKDTYPTQDSAGDTQLREVVRQAVNDSGEWSLDKILVHTESKTRKGLVDQEENAIAFISWVIYGGSQSGIVNPTGLAISRLKENPRLSAGGKFDRLASLSPTKFTEVMLRHLKYHWTPDADWNGVFGQVSDQRIELLADCLHLQLNQSDDFSSPINSARINCYKK